MADAMEIINEIMNDRSNDHSNHRPATMSVPNDEEDDDSTRTGKIDNIDFASPSTVEGDGVERDEVDDEIGPMPSDTTSGNHPTFFDVSDRCPLYDPAGNDRLSLGAPPRGQHVHVRDRSDSDARSPTSRRRRTFFKTILHVPTGIRDQFKKKMNQDNDDDSNSLRPSDLVVSTSSSKSRFPLHGRMMVSTRSMSNNLAGGHSSGAGAASDKQYSLDAVKPSAKSALMRWIRGSGQGIPIYENTGIGSNSSINGWVIAYLHWTFRQSFFVVFLSSAILFFAITFLFAFCFWGIGRRHPTCIGGVDFSSDYFTDAYILSWETFSTVGYGLIYVGTSVDEPDIRKCTGITILITLEAFIGMLYASMLGAILYAKVSRIQSFAQVLFSDPLVIRYGNGVSLQQRRDEGDANADDGLDKQDEEIATGIPWPILEFRLVNQMHALQGGEIIDACVKVTAIIDADQVMKRARSEQHVLLTKSTKSNLKRRSMLSKSIASRKNVSSEKGLSSKKESAKGHRTYSTAINGSLDSITDYNAASKTRQNSMHQAFVEDPTGQLVPKRIFSNLELTSAAHPFFRRVWMVRHTLDANSPLLTVHARILIGRNGGHWPRHLNTAADVRHAVRFDKLLVSVSGVSNADANTVYARKMYDYADVNVGYRFVNMLFQDPVSKILKVDTTLINDAMEQVGGGGEELHGLKIKGSLHEIATL